MIFKDTPLFRQNFQGPNNYFPQKKEQRKKIGKNPQTVVLKGSQRKEAEGKGKIYPALSGKKMGKEEEEEIPLEEEIFFGTDHEKKPQEEEGRKEEEEEKIITVLKERGNESVFATSLPTTTRA